MLRGRGCTQTDRAPSPPPRRRNGPLRRTPSNAPGTPTPRGQSDFVSRPRRSPGATPAGDSSEIGPRRTPVCPPPARRCRFLRPPGGRSDPECDTPTSGVLRRPRLRPHAPGRGVRLSLHCASCRASMPRSSVSRKACRNPPRRQSGDPSEASPTRAEPAATYPSG